MSVASKRGVARGWPWFLLCALALTGCGAFTERLAGWYVTRKLDSYLDFHGDQKARARTRVDEAIHVLRTGEIPHWVSFLREVRQGIHEGLDDAAIARLQRHYDARLDAGVALLAPRFAAILVELAPDQLDHFAARMRDDIDEHYEERDLPPTKRMERIEARALDVLEDQVGDLSHDQEARFRQLVRSLPDERPAQYRAAHDNVKRFRALMAERPDVARLDASLRGLWEHRYDGLGPGRDKATRRTEQRRAWLVIDGLLTPAQRLRAEEALSERIRMLKRFALTAG